MFAGLTIAVGSGSAIKLAAVRAAFPEAASVEGYGVPSGVADQPSGAGETQEGALNRARGAREACPGADMWIAFENGMVRAEREGEGKGEGDGDGEGEEGGKADGGEAEEEEDEEDEEDRGWGDGRKGEGYGEEEEDGWLRVVKCTTNARSDFLCRCLHICSGVNSERRVRRIYGCPCMNEASKLAVHCYQSDGHVIYIGSCLSTIHIYRPHKQLLPK